MKKTPFLVSGLLIIFLGVFVHNIAQAAFTTTLAPALITSSSAQLRGTTQSPAGGYFRYSTVSSTACASGTRAPSTGAINYGKGGNFTQVISGLHSKTTYYYCAWGGQFNNAAPTHGLVVSFRTQ
jgi:hypothetical protein